MQNVCKAESCVPSSALINVSCDLCFKMAASLQKVLKQALNTFSKKCDPGCFEERLNGLKESINNLSASDLTIDERLLSYVSSHANLPAPCAYMHLWENPALSMGVFMLKEGTSIPLHDHPGMFGLMKILHGTATIQTYTPLRDLKAGNQRNIYPPQHRQQAPLAQPNVDKPNIQSDGLLPVNVLKNPLIKVSSGVGCEACLLTPDISNFHEIRAEHGTVAFFDILAPPYDHDTLTRVCQYYTEMPLPSMGRSDLCCLSPTEQPDTFWCDSVSYQGPKLEM